MMCLISFVQVDIAQKIKDATDDSIHKNIPSSSLTGSPQTRDTVSSLWQLNSSNNDYRSIGTVEERNRLPCRGDATLWHLLHKCRPVSVFFISKNLNLFQTSTQYCEMMFCVQHLTLCISRERAINEFKILTKYLINLVLLLMI